MLRKIILATQNGLSSSQSARDLWNICLRKNLHDVPSRFQKTGREETRQIGRVLGPAESCKWPETRAEPGVKDILVSNLWACEFHSPETKSEEGKLADQFELFVRIRLFSLGSSCVVPLISLPALVQSYFDIGMARYLLLRFSPRTTVRWPQAGCRPLPQSAPDRRGTGVPTTVALRCTSR